MFNYLAAMIFAIVFSIGQLSAEPRVVRVGLVFDLSGDVSEAPLDVVRGIEYAQRHLEKEGIYLQLRKYDSGRNAIGTQKAMKRVLRDKLDFIVAEVYSSKALVAAKMAEEAKRVMITPYATSPQVTKGRKYVFRTCFSDDFQGSRLAKFATSELKAKTAAVFYDASQIYSKTLADSFKAGFVKSGGEIKHIEPMLGKKKSFKAQLINAQKVNADIIFLPTYENTASRFVNEAVLRGFHKFVVLGGDGWGATQMFDDLVFDKKFPMQAYWTSHYSGNFSKEALKRAKHNYKEVSGRDFNASTAIGFDTAQIIARAVKIAGKTKSQSVYRDAIHKIKPFRGLSGKIYFGGSQDPSKSVFVRRVEGSKMGYVTEIEP